ncbi:nucleotide excision repair, TFIIH, subunit [Ceratobasidium sp. AG-Ba]|nr:nucleotide excision repair, TFIIH, subunit [Ceratobasidium sp. AG-Ba]QRW07214.1 nucleotide excision repair, TFIIH, subunit [Ceratobasidium sp. AG-Ba]
MRAFKGVLLTCDPAVKQILLILDKQPTGGFIVKDVDDTHVLVRADDVKRVRVALEAEEGNGCRNTEQLEKNTYTLE